MEVLTVERKGFKSYLTIIDNVYNLVLKEYTENRIKSLRMVYSIGCNEEVLRFMCNAFYEEDHNDVEKLATLLDGFKIGKTELLSISNFNLHPNHENVEH